MAALAVGRLQHQQVGTAVGHGHARHGALVGHGYIPAHQQAFAFALDVDGGGAQDVAGRDPGGLQGSAADGNGGEKGDRLHARQGQLHGFGGIERQVAFAFALLHDLQRVAQQDAGDGSGGAGAAQRDGCGQARHQRGQGAGVVAVGVGDEHFFGGAHFVQNGEIGQLLARRRSHADAGVDQQAVAFDLDEGAGGAHFGGTAEEVEFHGGGLPFISKKINMGS